MKNIGIILTLIGAGLFLLTVIFAQGPGPLTHKYVVLAKGRYVAPPPSSLLSGWYEDRVEFPARNSLAISVLMTLGGIGYFLLGPRQSIASGESAETKESLPEKKPL